MVLSVQGLTKHYKRTQALRGVSFEVPRGSVFGLLGPNGSGKTTLMGIVSDVLTPTAGTFSWFGEGHTQATKARIGTLLETPNFYHYLSGRANLEIAAMIKGRGADRIDSLLQWVSLWERRDQPFSQYSLGMKQRLAIASALLSDPEVLILDEPTNGLDPAGIHEIRTLIQQLHARGITLIISSHLLDEIEKVCTHVAMLQQGSLLGAGRVTEVFGDVQQIRVQAAEREALYHMLAGWPGVQQVQDTPAGLLAEVPQDFDAAAFNRACFAAGISLSLLHVQQRRLEESFLSLLQSQPA